MLCWHFVTTACFSFFLSFYFFLFWFLWFVFCLFGWFGVLGFFLRDKEARTVLKDEGKIKLSWIRLFCYPFKQLSLLLEGKKKGGEITYHVLPRTESLFSSCILFQGQFTRVKAHEIFTWWSAGDNFMELLLLLGLLMWHLPPTSPCSWPYLARSHLKSLPQIRILNSTSLVWALYWEHCD